MSIDWRYLRSRTGRAVGFAVALALSVTFMFALFDYYAGRRHFIETLLCVAPVFLVLAFVPRPTPNSMDVFIVLLTGVFLGLINAISPMDAFGAFFALALIIMANAGYAVLMTYLDQEFRKTIDQVIIPNAR